MYDYISALVLGFLVGWIFAGEFEIINRKPNNERI